MRKRRHQWHMDGIHPSAGRTLGMVALMAGGPLLAGALFASVPAVAVGALVGSVLACRVGNAGWRVAVRVDDDSLTEVYVHGGRRRYLWADLASVAMDDDGATLWFARGQVRLAPPLANWAMIAARARRQLGEEVELDPDAAEMAISQEEVARWLGGGHDPLLVCREPARLNLAAIVMVALAVACAGMACGSVILARLGLVSAAAAVTWRLVDWQSRRALAKRPELGLVCEVRAAPGALDIRTHAGWTSVPWGAIVGRRGNWLADDITTLRGDFIVPRTLRQRRQLLEAVDQAIAARRAGFVLPRLTGDVPEAALSPAVLSVDAERGLSPGVPEADSI